MEVLENMITSISNAAGDYLPSTVGAILLLLIGWFFAGIIKKIITKLIQKTGIDKRFSSSKLVLSRFVGKLAYFLMMIFVFTIVLEKLGMQSVLEPVKTLLNGFLGYIPNIIAAGLVGYIGYMLAVMVSELVGMSAATINRFVPKLNLTEGVDFVGIIKKIVFIFIFIPLVISALGILNIDTISVPATAMLSEFFAAIPKVMLATLILLVFIVGGKFLTEILHDLLAKMNVDNMAKKMQLGRIGENTNLPKTISRIAYFFIIIFGLLTAIEKLEFASLTDILTNITATSGKILYGLVIILIGNWVATMAKNAFSKTDANTFVAAIIRTAILAIFIAMGLKTMGMADDIINMAFGITLGTIAITVALSFGLGGREAAGKQMSKILDKFNQK